MLTPIKFPLSTVVSLQQKVVSYYENWKKQYVREYFDGSYVVFQPSGSEATVSEAHGYLMLSAVCMNDKIIFDRALKYYLRFQNSNKQMCWRQCRSGNNLYTKPEDNSSATDGDMDIIYALILASFHWKQSSYLVLAKESLSSFAKSCVNSSIRSLKLGDWSVSNSDKFGRCTRSSDFMLGHIEVFAAIDSERSSLWKSIESEILSIANACSNKENGLISDFIIYENNIWKPVVGQILEAETDGTYSWNACRTPMRLALYSCNEKLKGMFESLNVFIKKSSGVNPSKISAGYKLNGDSLASYSDLAFVAPMILVAGICEDLSWMNKLTEYVLNKGFEDYFGDTIGLLCLIVASGKYLSLNQVSNNVDVTDEVKVIDVVQPTPIVVPTPTTQPTQTPTTIKEWKLNSSYKKGEYVTYRNITFTALVSHIALDPNWNPLSASSLWKRN